MDRSHQYQAPEVQEAYKKEQSPNEDSSHHPRRMWGLRENCTRLPVALHSMALSASEGGTWPPFLGAL